MNLKRKYSLYKKVALCMALIMFAEAFYPTVSFALTSGPSSPEFSSFEPASTTSMVNEFSGSFTYNIPVLEVPGANGGGYACGLSYHSGETVESEASWVGYGWTLNPGAINRHKKGFADDANGDEVKYINDVPANWTISGGVFANLEAFSMDVLNTNASIKYNNYKGFGYTVGAGINLGIASLGYSVSDGQGSFQTRSVIGEVLSLTGATGGKAIEFMEAIGSTYGVTKLGDDVRPTTVTPYTGHSVNMTVSTLINPFVVPVGGELGNSGTFSIQQNQASTSLKAYGYMYSANAVADNPSQTMMDYYIENEDMYNKRDLYMSAPFSNADIYTASGEGMGGGFRLYNKKSGTFFPNEVTSTTDIAQIGLTADVGLTSGVGGNLGVGNHTLSVKRNFSTGNGNTDDYNFAAAGGDEGTFFRFFNDMGGSLNYTTSTAARGASIGAKTPIVLESDINKAGLSDMIAETNANRSGRSSYIAYHTNAEMASAPYAYEKSGSTADLVNRNLAPNGVGEIVAFNADGNRYVYGLPVYSRNEQNMHYGLRGVSGGAIENRYLAYAGINKPFSQVGEINNAPYANTYLVTEITTPDYLDRTLDGPSDDDFGGYTKFEYTKAYGHGSTTADPNNWYKWRMPYNGLLYVPNSLTDNLDDMGAMSTGEKEVCYVKKIETKTHVAIFVTNKTSNLVLGDKTINGSGTSREDGLDANHDDNTAASTHAKGGNAVQMLERIELYAKPTDGSSNYKLIKTTHFEYDYSLCTNLPNSSDGGGKLTLKKVWFEYEGIANARISPYKFDYQYPVITPGSNAALAPYVGTDILSYGVLHNITPQMQNPPYDPLNLDRWGSPQADGVTRHLNLNPWVDQTSAAFDPAAWQLKKITLPSGGEILVQYEQQDYLYVQDRRAMAMVSLDPTGPNSDNKFYLNTVADMGITSTAQKAQLAALIRKELIDKQQKIYFKFLYKLLVGTPQIGNCTSDYIKGYVNVTDVGIDNDRLFIQIDDGGYQLPKQVCIDYVKREKGGKLGSKHSCSAEDGIPKSTDPISLLKQLLAFSVATLDPSITCFNINESLSYLRIPVLNAKKGGGIRVKRVLMHDTGIETGDQALYGTEYFYTDVDGNSSGVAVNEPTLGREENALVTFLPKRTNQTFWGKVIAGKDKQQFEGPLGEHLLPGASIGYSRVVAKSIQVDTKTNTGFVVNEFYTAKDYPFDKNYNTYDVQGAGVANTGIFQNDEWRFLPIPFFALIKNNLWLSQSYRFIINEMHGQQRSIATYAGDYSAVGTPETSMLASKQEFNYFEPGEQVPIMTKGVTDPIEMLNPGKETEVVMERKAISDIGINGKVEVDLQMSLLFPFIAVYPTAMPSISYSESRLETHVTSKVVKYPVILKSVTTFQDGIYHFTQNLAFSPTTGEPLITKTTDGFNKLNLQQTANHDGSYLTYELPASSQYKEMGQKAANERRVLSSTTFPNVTMSLTNSGGNYYVAFAASSGTVCDAMNTINRGDLVKIIGSAGAFFFHTDEIAGSSINILPATLYNPSVNIGNGSVSSVEIVRSGKTNQLNEAAGSFTTYGAKQAPVTTTPSSSTAFLLRQQVATLLNNAIIAGSTTIDVGYVNSLTPELKNSLKINYGGQCRDINDPAHPFSIAYSGNQFTLRFQDQAPIHIPAYDESFPIPAAEVQKIQKFAIDLNSWADLMWTRDEVYWYGSPGNDNSNKNEFTYRNYGYYARGAVVDASSNSKIIRDQYLPAGIYGSRLSSVAFESTGSVYKNNCEGWAYCKAGYRNRPIAARFCSFGFTLGGTNGQSSNFHLFFSPGVFSVSADAYFSAPSGYVNSSIRYLVTGEGVSPGYIYDFYMKQYSFRNACGSFQVDANGYLYYFDNSNTKTVLLSLATRPSVHHNEQNFPATYYSTQQTLTNGGHFEVDPASGQLVYYNAANPCYPQQVTQNFCNPVVGPLASKTINNVIACGAATYDCNWPYDQTLFPAPSSATNVYETGVKGKWRMSSSYVYNSPVKSGSKNSMLPSSTDRNYNDAGIYPMVLFDWKNGNNDFTKWLRTSTNNKYSPNGEAIEKSDALGVKSAAKYGYKGKLPYLVAKNSDYVSSQFESFENIYGNAVEEGVLITSGQMDNTTAHSGKSSLKLATGNTTTWGTSNASNFVLKPIPVTPQITTNGLNVKVWVKKDLSLAASTTTPIAARISQLNTPGTNQVLTLNKVAQTGEWTLFEATVKPNSSITSAVITIINATLKNLWVDDVRVQPYDAKVMTYVYDNATMRLLASFDDQHFGLFYQYNAEGKLVRKLIETERGTKTVQETQYHMPLQNR